MTFLPAKRKGDLVLCGEPSCPAVLGTVTAGWLTLTLGLVELTDTQGKPYEPPCYAESRGVRRRKGATARTGKRIALFRGRLRRASPETTGERAAVLSRSEVWVRCPRGCEAITVVARLQNQ